MLQDEHCRSFTQTRVFDDFLEMHGVVSPEHNCRYFNGFFIRRRKNVEKGLKIDVEIAESTKQKGRSNPKKCWFQN